MNTLPLHRLPMWFKIWWAKQFLKMFRGFGPTFNDDIVLFNELELWIKTNGRPTTSNPNYWINQGVKYADLDKANADRDKAFADRDKAYADRSKAKADLNKANADWDKANADWDNAYADWIKAIADMRARREAQTTKP